MRRRVDVQIQAMCGSFVYQSINKFGAGCGQWRLKEEGNHAK